MSYQLEAIAACCQNSSIGKLLPTALYVHIAYLRELEPLLQDYEHTASSVDEQTKEATLVKFNTNQLKISYLFYPSFDLDPHPALQFSLIVDLVTRETQTRDYSQSANPPILHRKETFVGSNYHLYREFAHLTQCESALGLLDSSQSIGTKKEWEQIIKAHHLSFVGHNLVCLLQPRIDTAIERHRAAISRSNLSRPVRLALEANLFTPGATFFDYGCGYGEDSETIAALGYQSFGWDPYYRREQPLIKSDIVNLGYVINVIEDFQERRQALLQAWELTNQVLIVAAQVLIDDGKQGWLAYGDGIITQRHTFQKYYQQTELKSYIDQVLQVDAIAVDLGVFFVFKDSSQAEGFRASRFHRRIRTPGLSRVSKRYEDYQELLAPLMTFMTERGRLPVKGELSNESELKAELGTIRRAFKLISQVTDFEAWEAIAEQRRQDLLLYLALSSFGARPRFQQLSPIVREDIKALLGNYQEACLIANLMLVTVSDLQNLADLAAKTSVGTKSQHHLLIHISALDSLDLALRLYEGCASRNFGRLENANLIKFSWRQPQITYLYCPDFDEVAHPTVTNTMTVSLDKLEISYHEYQIEDNPPIIHQKDALVSHDYPNYAKFAKLTRQEQDWGLGTDLYRVSHLQDWLKCLTEKGITISGHSLRWRKDLEPYRLKLLRAQVQARRRQQK
ncbi:DNA phosphorothioation-associated putative methyltransferase [Gloeocapsa sp. PCC 73106]|uniref:DNA phosphorothioation-associated putative methyltransferase n=1 Tax=Gloeocapsa sp. PCC 73106 TaxID=102232 RepID=UPI0002ABE525|nr:DNA phosphorothioation-associated putative methyltransferase [Gloeocapsa sp. PCC 73106]ELR97249.1 hypothetical protein GLO73106DRAFT_00010550 [Gloeocapsa sp. PCC 73106]